MNQHQRSIKVASLVLKEVELLNEQDIKSILEGTVTIKLSLHPKNSKQLNNQIKNLPKKDLQNLVNHLSLPNSKRDTKQILRDKIIERTIGFRLTSRAVRGEPISIEESDTETTQSAFTDSVQGELTSIPTEEKEFTQNGNNYH